MRIWKWALDVTDVQELLMPAGAKILAVQSQHGSPQLWAMVDEGAPVETRGILTYGTGQEMPGGDAGQYIGTYQIDDGYLVFHVFEMNK